MNIIFSRDLPQSVTWDPTQQSSEVSFVCWLIFGMVLRLFSLLGAAEPTIFRSWGRVGALTAALSGAEKRVRGLGTRATMCLVKLKL
jgi:hypothetical protein